MSRQSRSRALMAVVALFVLLSSAGYADALGVTPGRSTIDFKPGLVTEKTFTITNNDHREFNAYIYVEGDMSEYIEIDNDIISFDSSDNSKTVTYRLRLPERIEQPGDHWGKIVVMELPTGWESHEGETMIAATVAVMHQVRVKVPYPGTYLQLDMMVQEAVPGEPVKFFVKMYNTGKEDIAKASATIEILGPTNEVIGRVETESSSIKSMQKGELVGVWEGETNPGLYNAVATVRYDGEVVRIEKNFYVGNMLVDILEITVKDFSLGSVAKFDMLTESRWNDRINDVYAHVIINDQNENKVADFKSASIDMEAFEKAHLYSYWDTEGVMEGDYIATLALHYGDRVTERDINAKVGLNSISMDFAGAGAVTSEGEVLDQYPIMILVTVLIAINLGWFLYFRKRKNK